MLHRSLLLLAYLGTFTSGDEVAFPFEQITKRGFTFDKNFFDGGTSWQSNGIFPSGKDIDAGRIKQIEAVVMNSVLNWPVNEEESYDLARIPNFVRCDNGVVICCFTQEQDPETGMKQPISAANANANVCHHNMESSRRASHTKNGVTFMTDGREIESQVKDAYCTGFAWNPNAPVNDTNVKYKANTLFYISMLQGFHEKGYVGQVPGSPMCGCSSQMPTVTKSSCVKPVDTVNIESSVRRNERHLQLSTGIEFVPCNNNDDLLEYYRDEIATGNEEKIKQLESILVGENQCASSVDEVLAPMAYKRGTAWWYADPSTWTPLYGKNDLYHPSIGSSGFRLAYEASSTKIIRRVCTSCSRSKRYHDIYYRRNETEVTLPQDMDLLEYLTSSWTDVNNEMGTDFNLYSSHDDALNRINPWTFCNYSSSRGFPNECGPDGVPVTNQWSSTNAKSYAKDFAFYLEK